MKIVILYEKYLCTHLNDFNNEIFILPLLFSKLKNEEDNLFRYEIFAGFNTTGQ